MTAYLRWLVAPFRISKIDVLKVAGQAKGAMWTHHYPVGKEAAHNRNGVLAVLPDLTHLEEALSEQLLGSMIAGKDGGVPLNYLHIVVGQDAFPNMQDRTLFYNSDEELAKDIKKCGELFARKADILRSAGVGEICIALPQPPRHPRFAMFVISPETEEWGENRLGRDMWPSFVSLLELTSLQRGYTLQRIHKEVRPTSHIYLGTQASMGTNKASAPELFMRGISYVRMSKDTFSDCLVDSLDVAMEEVEHAMLDPRVAKYGQTVTSRIYLHFLCELDMEPSEIEQHFMETVNSLVGQRGADILKLCIDEIDVKVYRGTGEQLETLRLTSSSLAGGFMKPKMLREFPDPVTGNPVRWETVKDGQTASEPGSGMSKDILSQIQAKRVAARRAGSMYAYDLPGLLKVALSMKWASGEGMSRNASGDNFSSVSGGARKRSPSPRSFRASSSRNGLSSPSGSMMDLTAEMRQMPKEILKAVELVMDWDKMELQESDRSEGQNNIGMLAWKVTMKTPEYPEGRVLIVIANDVTYQAGSFGVKEDHFFQKASELARKLGLPRIYVSCNSGARVGLVEELKPLYKVHWLDASDPGKGFEYLYLTKADFEKLPAGTVEAHMITEKGEERYVIDAIIGDGQKSTAGGIGVENLQGSGLIAGETSRAYQETFTLSYITGRSVGIGAYLNRLGQRNIQMVSSPMILTGYMALNKLLGKNVYSSQDQLGGPQIMVPNGVTHQVVRDDQEGISAILDWLSFVPKDVSALPPMRQPFGSGADTWDRDVEFEPTPMPYDPRDFLRGVIDSEGRRLRGFFDTGSWIEYLEGWGQTVIAGRARLGGVPMGVIAVETRTVDRLIPADPSNSESCEVKETNSGKVWFPDSAFKTAQALRDFGRAENLPVMIFANWRGFSGGTRDMYGEILKYGAMIVDALVEYQHPIFIYIPKHGELRGGAWVVIDPAINPEKMEMYADNESRGGILEPAGIVEVKYRAPQQVESMHRHDTKLQELDAQVAKAEGAEKQRLEKLVKEREKQLLPLYTSVATTFADLHDKTGRMKAKGVIREALNWKDSRRYFYWRVKRRVLQDFLIHKLRDANKSWTHNDALDQVKRWTEASQVDFASDPRMVSWLEAQNVEELAASCKSQYLKTQIEAMFRQLPEAERKAMMEQAMAAASKGYPSSGGASDATDGQCSLM
eukprot:TRINITY_DN27520_c0_g1_i1.p1 TRINITY_DN27520_c0_g1~~TRINITY_DN27520_c0_g1_i1.p1  ORF type:complete len:1234 (+),score=270.47 TRINITY_DN27520_c0_g1_i1:159-3704(+)